MFTHIGLSISMVVLEGRTYSIEMYRVQIIRWVMIRESKKQEVLPRLILTGKLSFFAVFYKN